MIKHFAPLAAEGNSDGGTGIKTGDGAKMTPYEYKKQQWPKSESTWGKQEDTWDTQSLELRKQAGIGKKEKADG